MLATSCKLPFVQLECCLFVVFAVALATEVNLRVFGSQDNNSFITLCPNDKFLLVAECEIMESRTLTWSLRPLLSSPVVITILDNLGEDRDGSVKFVLTKRALAATASGNSYTSQVQVHTDAIRESIENNEEFLIRCEAETATEYALVTLKFAGKVYILCG